MKLEPKKLKHIYFDIKQKIQPADENFTLIYEYTKNNTSARYRVWYDVKYKEEAFIFWFSYLDFIIETNLKNYYDPQTTN